MYGFIDIEPLIYISCGINIDVPICFFSYLLANQDRCYTSSGPFAQYRKLMERWEGGQLRTWRWNSLIQVLRALLMREQALKCGWDKDKFGDIGTTSTIDGAIASELFWKYAHFLNNVAGTIELGSSYCEGCECHEHEGLKHNSFQVRRNEILKRLRSTINVDSSDEPLYPPSCPLKNRRSAELASGAFNRFIEDTLTVTKEKLYDFRGTLLDAEWQIILSDWMSARVA